MFSFFDVFNSTFSSIQKMCFVIWLILNIINILQCDWSWVVPVEVVPEGEPGTGDKHLYILII